MVVCILLSAVHRVAHWLQIYVNIFVFRFCMGLECWGCFLRLVAVIIRKEINEDGV